jgi:hypothetical protein
MQLWEEILPAKGKEIYSFCINIGEIKYTQKRIIILKDLKFFSATPVVKFFSMLL